MGRAVGVTRGGDRLRLAALWPGALALALGAVLAITALAVRALQASAASWERLLETEVAALVEAERLGAASELGARLTRDAILTADPRAYRALGLNRALVADLLGRARSRARDPEDRALVEALVGDLVAISRAGDALMDARDAGAPVDALVSRLEQEVRPIRNRIDERLAAYSRRQEAALSRRRTEIAAAERGAFAALGAGAAVAIALALAMAAGLRSSLRALRGSEARFRATFEQAAVGIAHVGLDGRWLRLNARFQELLGRTDDELRGTPLADVAHPDDDADDAALMRRLLAGELEGFTVEKRFRHRDGSARWASLTCSLVHDRSGRPEYLVAAVADIGDRKRAEEELREAVRARDEFLQVASHELRTPLASLRLQVESARAAIARGAPSPQRLASKFEAALRQVGRLNSLVDALLDVSGLATAEVVLAPADDDLADAARAAVERARAAAFRDGTELRLEAPDAVAARFDRARIEQAIGHLVSNALRYGVGKPVDVEVSAAGGLARVVVRDRGMGVAPPERERIFERFARAASWHHYGGLGLGLFVTRRVALAHGGAVRVEGAPGEGAVFVLELPVDGPGAERAHRPEREAREGSPESRLH